jgi:RNA polymerase sigma factor (sigma-70 family)
MTINPHTMRTLGRERTADLRRAAAADRTAREGNQSASKSEHARQDPSPAGDAGPMSAVLVTTSTNAMRHNLRSRARVRVAPRRLPPERIAELVEDAARGDERAWNGLVGQFGGIVWAVTRAHRLREADASDVFQTTWLRLLEHLRELKNPASVGSWLATTARRECLRVLRDDRRHVLQGDDPFEDESPDMAPGDALCLNERDDAVRRGFSRLRASDQALLRLVMAEPRPPYEEIAAALDMPIGSIGPTRQRALMRLHRELRAQGTLSLAID